MSKRYIGGLITKSPTVPTTSAAPGIWTLDQALYYIKAGTWPQPPTYIEDVFSTYLYTGNGSTQTITNGINLSGQGGMVWIKTRNYAFEHFLLDTARGSNSILHSEKTNAAAPFSNGSMSFLSNGFSLSGIGYDSGSNGDINGNGSTFASWTFREAPKFFDVVTYTGNGSSSQTLAHNLGVAPGFIVVKSLNVSGNWVTYHRSLGATDYMLLNTTSATAASITAWNNTNPTTTNFTVGSSSDMNTNGNTYVAYLFAHDTSSTGLIQCGSFTTDVGGNFSVSLGWEPQFVMVKRTDAAQNWHMADTMRGFSQTQFNTLIPNLSNAEAANSSNYIAPNATGFSSIGNQFLSGSATYIYIAIRRGPMKTPTVGTSVFTPIKQTTTGFTTISGVGFSPDLAIARGQSVLDSSYWVDKLRGPSRYINANNTNAEASDTAYMLGGWTNDGAITGSATNGQFNGYNPDIQYYFRRAPSFFDEVCYTGTGSATTFNHNLGVAPELMIVKRRNTTGSWSVYAAPETAAKWSSLNTTDAFSANSTLWNNTSPTTSVFTVGSAGNVNVNGSTYVAYLFASCPGVSKVGSYTGTGALQTINCGFTTGARFVLIKRTDSTGDWYVWDSARGITSGNDPYLLWNSDAAEVTGTNYVDTDTTGFKVTAAAPAALNANGGTYIFLAVA